MFIASFTITKKYLILPKTIRHYRNFRHYRIYLISYHCILSFCKFIFNTVCPPVYSHLFYFGKVSRKIVSKFPARFWFCYPFYQQSISIKIQIIDWGNELKLLFVCLFCFVFYLHLKYYHTFNPVCSFIQYHEKIYNFT